MQGGPSSKLLPNWASGDSAAGLVGPEGRTAFAGPGTENHDAVARTSVVDLKTLRMA
jgi:hypothetical protein